MAEASSGKPFYWGDSFEQIQMCLNCKHKVCNGGCEKFGGVTPKRKFLSDQSREYTPKKHFVHGEWTTIFKCAKDNGMYYGKLKKIMDQNRCSLEEALERAKSEENMQREVILYDIDGEKLNAMQIAKKYGINYNTLRERLKKMTMEEAIKKKIKHYSEIEIGGKKLTIREFAERYHVHPTTLYHKMKKYTAEEIAAEFAGEIPGEASSFIRHHKYIEAFGRRMKLSEWAKICDIPRQTLQSRLDRGYTPEEVFEKARKILEGMGK